MRRTILAATFLSISFVSTGVAKDPDSFSDSLMVSPSDDIPRAPIGHRQPTPSDLVAPKSAFDGTVGANLRKSDSDQQIDAIDREIMEENKEVDRKISGICRGC
jgi:hypothetical protein